MKKNSVLVTGGSGYIGVETVIQLLKKNYEVVVVDKKSFPFINKFVTSIKYDLRKPFPKRLLPIHVDYCIHLAANVGGIWHANKYPATILHDNILIDTNVLDAIRDISIKRYVYVSSSLVYEKSKKFPYKEGDTEIIPLPSLTYGLGKILGEKMCAAFNQEYNIEYAVCRLFNAYGLNSNGKTDPHGHVIPELIDKIASLQYPLEIYGTGEQRRNFTHVIDLASGIIAVLENKKASNQIFNIASSREHSINQIIRILWKLQKRDVPLKTKKLKSFSQDVERNAADTSKIRKLLGWKTRVSMRKGLYELVSQS